MGKQSRDKGARFERETAIALRPIYPNAKRGAQLQTSNSMGRRYPDVEGTPFFIECKVGQRPNLFAAQKQLRRDVAISGDRRTPIVVAKRDRDQPVVMIDLEDFLRLCRIIESGLGAQNVKDRLEKPGAGDCSDTAPAGDVCGGDADLLR